MAERMNEHEIIKLLENLIGPVEAAGDSSIDEKIKWYNKLPEDDEVWVFGERWQTEAQSTSTSQ